MFVGDSRSQSGPGFLPLQDHGFLDRKVPLENRASIIGLRITNRQDDAAGFGIYEEDPAARGDLSGFLHWPAESRSIGGWREVWPVIVPPSANAPEGPTTPGGPDGEVPPGERTPRDPPSRGPITPSSRGGGSSPVGGQDVQTGRSVEGPTDPGGPTNADPGGVDQSTADGTGGGGEDSGSSMLAEPAQSPTFAAPSQAMLPGIGEGFAPDARFQPINPTARGGSQTLPGGTVGAIVQATNEDKQFEYFLHGDPRLISANRGGPFTHGTAVHDVNGSGSIDKQRGATLQSLCRVLKSPSGDFSLAGKSRNVLALNIGRTGQNEAIGGLWCDKGGKSTWVGAVSVRDGGPFDVTDGCKHQIGSSGDGDPISPLHFSTLAFWRNKTGDEQKDGPLYFEGPNWPDPPDLSYKCMVHLDFDEKAPYEWARDDSQKTDQGMWKWWSYALMGTDTGDPAPTDPQAPQTPGGEPEDPPPTGGGGGGGPQTGGGGNPQQPGGQGPGGGGAGQGPGTGGSTVPGPGTGGGTPPPPPTNGAPPSRSDNASYPTTQWPGNSQSPQPRHNHYSHMEFSQSAISAKAQMVGRGLQHLTDQLQPEPLEWQQFISEAPLTGRLRSYGAQGGEPGADPFGGRINHSWAYTQEPGASRYSAGTSSGGWVLMPPEMDMTDAPAGFRPDFPTSETFFVAAPGAALAVGEPEFATGGVKNGHSIIETDTSSPNGFIGPGLLIREHDSDGVATDQLRLENGKEYILDWVPVTVDGSASPYSVPQHAFVNCDTTNGPVDLTLFAADASNKGQEIGIRKATAGGDDIILNASPGDTINGAATYIIGNSTKQYEATTFVSNGAGEWWIVANF